MVKQDDSESDNAVPANPVPEKTSSSTASPPVATVAGACVFCTPNTEMAEHVDVADSLYEVM